MNVLVETVLGEWLVVLCAVVCALAGRDGPSACRRYAADAPELQA